MLSDGQFIDHADSKTENRNNRIKDTVLQALYFHANSRIAQIHEN